MPRVNSPIPVREIAAGSDTYDRGYHKGDSGGLDAVDPDLAAGNIASGVTVFGKAGTYTGGDLAEDVLAYGDSLILGNLNTSYGGRQENIAALSELDMATTTDTYDASCLAVIAGFANARCSWPSVLKLRLYVDGVQRVETAYLSSTVLENFVMQWTQALSGSKTCKIAAYNYDAGTQRRLESAGLTGYALPYVISVGSVKK